MGVEARPPGYSVAPFSSLRQQQLDWLELMRRQHTIHALLELDVTQTRASLRACRNADGPPVSLTAFIIWCVARAVDADKGLQACRSGRSRLVLFDDVDATVLVERRVGGQRIPLPLIIRAANRKTPLAIAAEICAAQTEKLPQARALRGLSTWLLVPAPLRRLVWQALLGNPHWRKRMMGTVAVSAVGMFGRGPAWGIPLTAYPLCITVGGISRQPRTLAVSSHGESELLSLTVSCDHALIDGAPAARFCQRLRELIEAGLNAKGKAKSRVASAEL
jgi:hypothetical protein